MTATVSAAVAGLAANEGTRSEIASPTATRYLILLSDSRPRSPRMRCSPLHLQTLVFFVTVERGVPAATVHHASLLLSAAGRRCKSSKRIMHVKLGENPETITRCGGWFHTPGDRLDTEVPDGACSRGERVV